MCRHSEHTSSLTSITGLLLRIRLVADPLRCRRAPFRIALFETVAAQSSDHIVAGSVQFLSDRVTAPDALGLTSPTAY